MIQGNTWHEYSNDLKRFLCDVAKSRWAWYLFYPLGVLVAIHSDKSPTSMVADEGRCDQQVICSHLIATVTIVELADARHNQSKLCSALT